MCCHSSTRTCGSCRVSTAALTASRDRAHSGSFESTCSAPVRGRSSTTSTRASIRILPGSSGQSRCIRSRSWQTPAPAARSTKPRTCRSKTTATSKRVQRRGRHTGERVVRGQVVRRRQASSLHDGTRASPRSSCAAKRRCSGRRWWGTIASRPIRSTRRGATSRRSERCGTGRSSRSDRRHRLDHGL